VQLFYRIGRPLGNELPGRVSATPAAAAARFLRFFPQVVLDLTRVSWIMALEIVKNLTCSVVPGVWRMTLFIHSDGPRIISLHVQFYPPDK